MKSKIGTPKSQMDSPWKKSWDLSGRGFILSAGVYNRCVSLMHVDVESVLRRLRTLVLQINATALKLNTLGTNALKSAVVGVDLETEMARLEQRRSHEGTK